MQTMPASRWSRATEIAINGLTILVLLSALLVVWRVLLRPRQADAGVLKAGDEVKSLQLADSAGRDSAVVSLRGKGHVVYVFRTTCPACSSQRSHLAEVFRALPADQVITGSFEPRALTAAYWAEAGAPAVRPPLRFGERVVGALHLTAVPALYVFDGRGRLVHQRVGVTPDLTAADLKRLLASE